MEHMIGRTLKDFAKLYPSQQVKVGYENGVSFFYCGNDLNGMLSELEAVEVADAYYRLYCAQEDVVAAITATKTASEYLKYHYARHNIPTKADYDRYLENRFANIGKLDEKLGNRRKEFLMRRGIQKREIKSVTESIVTQGEYIILIEGKKKQDKYWDKSEFDSMYYTNVRYLYDKLTTDKVSELIEFALGEAFSADYIYFMDSIFKPLMITIEGRRLFNEGHDQSMESKKRDDAGAAC